MWVDIIDDVTLDIVISMLEDYGFDIDKPVMFKGKGKYPSSLRFEQENQYIRDVEQEEELQDKYPYSCAMN